MLSLILAAVWAFQKLDVLGKPQKTPLFLSLTQKNTDQNQQDLHGEWGNTRVPQSRSFASGKTHKNALGFASGAECLQRWDVSYLWRSLRSFNSYKIRWARLGSGIQNMWLQRCTICTGYLFVSGPNLKSWLFITHKHSQSGALIPIRSHPLVHSHMPSKPFIQSSFEATPPLSGQTIQKSQANRVFFLC